MQANLFDILVHFIGKTAEAEELINQAFQLVYSSASVLTANNLVFTESLANRVISKNEKEKTMS